MQQVRIGWYSCFLNCFHADPFSLTITGDRTDLMHRSSDPVLHILYFSFPLKLSIASPHYSRVFLLVACWNLIFTKGYWDAICGRQHTRQYIEVRSLQTLSKILFSLYFFLSLKVSGWNLIQRLFYPLGYITYEIIYDPWITRKQWIRFQISLPNITKHCVQIFGLWKGFWQEWK